MSSTPISSNNTPQQTPRLGRSTSNKKATGRVKSLPKVAHDDLAPGTNLDLDYDIESLQAVLSWKSRNTKMGCDLDITGITYDLKGRFLEIIGFDSPISNDASIALSGDSDGLNGADEELLAIDLSSISPKVRAVVILATSLSGNFTEVLHLRSFVRKISYMKDSMASRPGVPKFKTHKATENKLLFNVGMQPSSLDSYNCLVLYKVYRDGTDHHQWKTNIVMKELMTRTKNEIMDKLEFSLGDIFPQKLPENQRLLPDVQSVCTSLSSHALPHLKKYFTMDPEGLSIDSFVKVLFKQLLKTMPRLADPKEASHAVAILEELFEQIDINGDTMVDWDEFTSFNIENGMSATKQSDHSNLDEYTVSIAPDPNQHNHDLGPLNPIIRMIYIPETKKVLTIQKDSDIVNAYSTKGHYVHSLQVGDKTDITQKQNLTVHDLVHIPTKNLIAIACSDNTIYLYEEELTAGGIHRKYSLKDTIFQHVLQSKAKIRLAWDAGSEILYSTGQNNKIYPWDIVSCRCKRDPNRDDEGHRDMIMDMVIIKDKNFLATCSMDKTIVLWGLENFTRKKTLMGHSHGVRKLAYCDSVLVSVGFEYDAVVWDIVSKEKLFTLNGHKSPIVDVTLLPSTIDKPTLAVTLDETGEFRIWDVALSLTTEQTALQAWHGFSSADGQQIEYNCILAPFCKELMVDQYSNILAGSSSFDHFIPIRNRKEFFSPNCVLYNSASFNFVAVIGSSIHLWDATDGSYIRSFADFSEDDIFSATTDYPRQRRVFVGDDRGKVSLLNYITGTALNHTDVHEGEVTSVVFCEANKMVITGGNDKKVCVLHDLDGELPMLRSIENAHKGQVSTLAYSHKLSIIVTGGHGDHLGDFKVWDFQRFSLKCIGGSTDKDVNQICIIEEYALIVVCGSNGVCHMWKYYWKGECAKLECLCRMGDLRMNVGHVTGIDRIKPGEGAPGYLVFTDDQGWVSSFEEEEILAKIKERRPEVVLDKIIEDQYPYKEPDYMPELKIHRDVRGYLSMNPVVPDDEKLLQVDVKYRWVAHPGHSIVKSMCIQNPSTVLTSSDDGFMCVWGLDGALLGEMRLPNVGEGKQYRRKQFHLPVNEIDWNFPQERHDVSERHIKRAEELLTTKRKPTRRFTHNIFNQKSVASVNATAMEEKKEGEGISKAKNLWNKLQKNIVRAPRLKNTLINAFGASFNVKHGRNKSPSRKGKRSSLDEGVFDGGSFDRKAFLQQLKTSGLKKEEKKTKKPSATKTGSPGRITTGSGGPGSFKISDFGDFFEETSPFERIRDTGKVPDVADAFTVRSVHLGVLDGMYDFEQMKQLTKIGKYKERREAYSRAYPVVVPSQLEKMAELRLKEPELELTLPQFALDTNVGKEEGKVTGPSMLPDLSYLTAPRPKTTGGMAKGESLGRQNWRGYKNLVNEFDKSTKNLRKPPITPAGISSTSRRKGKEYFPPGTAPPMAPLAGRQAIMLEMSTGLADMLEDDMSDSDDEHDGLAIDSPTKIDKRKRFDSGLTDDTAPAIHLHKVDRKQFDSSRNFGLRSQHMEKYRHQMEDADHERDLDLNVGTHADVVKHKLMEKRRRDHEAGKITIMTEADEIKRRFSSVMTQKAQVDEAIIKHMSVLAEEGEDGSPKRKLNRKGSSGAMSRKGSRTSLNGRMRRSMSVSSTTVPKSVSKKKKKKKLPEKWSELRPGSFGPNYTLDEVKHFYSCFSWVDKDYSGAIDVDEWQDFLLSMDQEMTPTESRRLFMHIDANHNGLISMDEICKVVFNKASPEQQRIMVHVMEHTTAMKKDIQGQKTEFTRADLRQLFMLYDEQGQKRLKVGQLSSAFMVLGIKQDVVNKIFEDAGIDPVHGDMDAEEFTDCFYGYLKGKVMSKVV